MSVNLKQMDAYVSGSTVVFDESSQSVPTKDLASVDSETSVDTILGVKDGVVSQIDTADLNVGSVGTIGFSKTSISNGYHRDFTLSGNSRGVCFILGTSATIRGTLYYNCTSTGGITYTFDGQDATQNVGFSSATNTITVTNNFTNNIYTLWVRYNGTITIGDQVANT